MYDHRLNINCSDGNDIIEGDGTVYKITEDKGASLYKTTLEIVSPDKTLTVKHYFLNLFSKFIYKM